MHTLRKLISTTKIVATLFCARTFGKYRHSGWNGECEYAVYGWRGHDWLIPTSPIEAHAAEIAQRTSIQEAAE